MNGRFEEQKSALLKDMAAAVGKRLMHAWNEGVTNPAWMAVMGHLEGGEYTFVIQDKKADWQVTVRNIGNSLTDADIVSGGGMRDRLRKILEDRLNKFTGKPEGGNGDPA